MSGYQVTCLPSSVTAPAFGMELLCRSTGSGKGWSGAGRWFGGGIMFRGSMSEAFPAAAAAFDGHSDAHSCYCHNFLHLYDETREPDVLVQSRIRTRAVVLFQA